MDDNIMDEGLFEDGDFNIAEELARFEREERERLGLEEQTHEQYVEQMPGAFTESQREHTTILVSGLTLAHDQLVVAAISGLGYTVDHLDVPDTDALRFGKEFGNRGQCNPTYFGVGNLVKFLSERRDEGMTVEEINNSYIFLTAGACGPCRFGMYVTEYRKALRDAGFEGFRVMLFQQQGGLKQATGEGAGLEFTPPFFIGLVKALLVADALNALTYRVRPYEVEEGATDAALERSKQLCIDALSSQTSIISALWKCRREFAAIPVDRTRIKPKVALIGEFWAMTTEGDGNYKMQRFLESEGAEVDIQLLTAWLLFMVWENVRDTKHRLMLREHDGGRRGLINKEPAKKIAQLAGAEIAVRGIFQSIANLVGLHGYHLPDMWEYAREARAYYNNDVRGGEGHMEVGKLIVNTEKKKSTMTLSVKPFGCMPSSAVSDGIQSIVTERYPEALYLPIETSGDGAVNVYSRVQMALFKARAAARKEVAEAEAEYGISVDEARRFINSSRVLRSPLFRAPHRYTTTAADNVALAGAIKNPRRTMLRWAKRQLGAVA